MRKEVAVRRQDVELIRCRGFVLWAVSVLPITTRARKKKRGRGYEKVRYALGSATYIAAKGPRPGCRRRVPGGEVEGAKGDTEIEVAEDELNSVFRSASY